MKLLGSTKSEINNDTKGENMPHLEIAEAVLFHCNIVNNDYQQHLRGLYTFICLFQINHLINYISHPKTLYS